MPTVPAPVAGGSGTQFNPNRGFDSSAGGASGKQTWYVHVQTVDIMYVRNNQFNSSTSSTTIAPTVTSNWMDMNYTVQTQDEVYYGVAFSSADSSSGNLFQPHILQLATDTGASGGFGLDGVVNTSAAGIIRRPARLDAAGNVLDTTGTCTKNGSLVVDQMAGSYNASYDTSSNVPGVLAQAMGKMAVACPTFKATLVEL